MFKYVQKAAERVSRMLKGAEYSEGRANTRRRAMRVLEHPVYGPKFAKMDAKDQRRVLERIHRPSTTVSPARKQKLMFADIEDTLKRKQKAQQARVRKGQGTPAERAARYARLPKQARSETWQADESVEFWDKYKEEMGA